jgi:endonuclease YncB( thermonuclease family)
LGSFRNFSAQLLAAGWIWVAGASDRLLGLGSFRNFSAQLLAAGWIWVAGASGRLRGLGSFRNFLRGLRKWCGIRPIFVQEEE